MHIPGRLVWLESVANEVCCDGCGPLSLVWGDQALCSLGRVPGAGHAAQADESPGGNVSRTLQPGQPGTQGWWPPSPLSPHQHQQLGLATDWVISPSHPWVIWTHQPGISAWVSWDRSWLLAFLTPKSPWPAGLTLSGPSVGKNHAIRKIKSIIYHLNTRGKGFDLRYMDNAMMYDQMCPSINVRPSTSKRWQWCNKDESHFVATELHGHYSAALLSPDSNLDSCSYSLCLAGGGAGTVLLPPDVW